MLQEHGVGDDMHLVYSVQFTEESVKRFNAKELKLPNFSSNSTEAVHFA